MPIAMLYATICNICNILSSIEIAGLTNLETAYMS